MSVNTPTIPVLVHYLLGSASVALATLITHPIDMLKVRLQVDKRKESLAPLSIKYLWETSCRVKREDGFKAFFAGIGAALVRAVVYGGVRLGLYEPLKSSLKKNFKNTNREFISAISASASGFVAAFAGNPFEVVKVRMQASASLYPNLPTAISRIISTEGIRSLWNGVWLAALRSSLLTVSQIFPYCFAKDFCASFGMASNSVITHVASSLFAGLITTTITSPVDVLKTRVMNVKNQNSRQLLIELIQKEGAGAFFRGWMANYIRLGPQTLFIFVFYEQLLKLCGYKDF